MRGIFRNAKCRKCLIFQAIPTFAKWCQDNQKIGRTFGHKKPPSACCKRRWSLTLNPITMSCPIQNPMQFCRLTTVHLFGVISGSLPLTSRPAHVMLLILGWSRSYSAEGFARPVRKGRMAHCGAFACVTFGGDISAPGRWRKAFAIYEKERNPCPLPSSGRTSPTCR